MRTNFKARWFWNTFLLTLYCGALLLHPYDIPSCELVSFSFLHHRFFSMASLYGRDENDRSSELSATTTIVLVLSVVFVALRFWARYVRIGYGTDDWLTLVALVGLIGCQELYNSDIGLGLCFHHGGTQLWQ